MRNSDSTRQTGFSEELSQLVKAHLSQGADPADIVSALSLQTEVVSCKDPGSAIDKSLPSDTSQHTLDRPYGDRR
jgi:hypothetical protein